MKKKSKYKPKPMRELPINMRFSRDIETKLQLIPHDCLAKFKAGQQDESDWHTLAARCNLGATLAHEHFPEVEPVTNAALEALRTSWERFRSIGKMGMNGTEYHAIAEALIHIDEMQKQCTRRELDAAMTYVFKQAGQPA